MKYSIIIPVYNRPEEADELLDSLTRQSITDFEVVVVEDGSAIPCKEVTEKYIDRLNIQYLTKKNGGPGLRAITAWNTPRASMSSYSTATACCQTAISRL